MAKNSMTKRLVGTLIAIIIAFSFLGCQSLQAYKENAKNNLDSYLRELVYTGGERSKSAWKNYINGPGVDEIINEGKASIDNASNKKDVDNALSDAKKAINTIPIWWKEPYQNTADANPPYDRMGFLFWLDIFDINGSFDCSTDVGNFFGQKNYIIKSGGAYGKWGQGIYCVPLGWNSDGVSGEALTEKAFMDITLKLKCGTIIGFVVVEIFLIDTTTYKARLLKSVINQKVDGQYEGIDEDGVKTQYDAIEEDEVKITIEAIKEEYKNKEK